MTILAFASITIIAQTESRIIRMEKRGEGARRYLEITSFKVGNTEINFNESFVADENWLKNIKVKVKNISGRNITCVGLSLGLLEGIDDKLEFYESWRYVLGFYKGKCSSGKSKSNSKLLLKDGESVVLTSADVPKMFNDYLDKPMKYKFHQAKFAYGATVIFQGEKEEAKVSYFSAPNNVRYFDEDDDELEVEEDEDN